MDTNKIKMFLLTKKYKNFSKIAEEFSYTPSAISHIADSLEEELGVKLFIRSRKGVELTEAGIILHDRFKAVVDAENELYKSVEEVKKGQSMTLRIGTYSSVALHILPALLQSFKKEYPKVKTTIVVDDYMTDWIENDKADIIIAENVSGANEWYPFMEDDFVAVVPEDMFNGKDKVFQEDLYNYAFIRPDEANLDEYFDFEKFREVISVKSIENSSAVYMVKENIGVTVLPKLVTKSLPDGVKTLKLIPEISRKIGIIYDKKHINRASEYFINHIKKNVE